MTQSEILVKNNQQKVRLNIREIKRKSEKIFEILNIKNLELSILFVDDVAIRGLNKRYRNKDKSTDVLSFPQIDFTKSSLKKILNNFEYELILGDVVISAETAKKQAEELGLTLKEELLRLLIHGILHLLDYDHENVSEVKRRNMKKKEEELFSAII